MPRASKNPVSKDIKREMEEAFSWFLTKELKGQREIKFFLGDFLTQEERLMLAKRLFIGYLVQIGVPYRNISSILKVSTNTVFKAGDRLIKSQGYKEIIEKLVKMEKSKDFNKKIEKILQKLPLTRKDWLRLAGRSGYPI